MCMCVCVYIFKNVNINAQSIPHHRLLRGTRDVSVF